MRPTEPWLRQHFQVGELTIKEAAVFCPFHKDKRSPSLYINRQTGKWKCHAGCGAGALSSLCKRLKIQPPSGAEESEGAGASPVRYVAPTVLAAAVKALWSRAGQDARKFLTGKGFRERGLSEKVIKKFQLGYYNERVSIPVFDHTGACVNLRLYDWTGSKPAKYMNFAQGHGEKRLWPQGILEKHDEVILLEGELDCLLAHSLGLDNALTTTGGASAWDNNWSRAFAGKTVLVCYDIDTAGRAGAAAVAQRLSASAAAVRVVELPIAEPANADLTDYARVLGFSRDRIQDLFGQARATVKPAGEASAARVHFAQLPSEHPDMGRALQLRAVVSGKDLTPFNVPAEATVGCVPSEKSAACQLCPCLAGGGKMTVKIPVTSKAVLRSVMSADYTVEKNVLDHIGVPARCPGNRVDITKTAPLWDVRLSPDVDSVEEEGAEGSRRAFSMEQLVTNQPYDLTLVSCSDPKTQYSLLHILKAKTSLTSLDAWTVKGKEELLKLWEV